MSTLLTYLLLVLILAAPLALLTTLAVISRRRGHLRFHPDQFPFAAPLTGRLFADDADMRRVEHDIDAIRSRFEEHPSWPSAGISSERR